MPVFNIGSSKVQDKYHKTDCAGQYLYKQHYTSNSNVEAYVVRKSKRCVDQIEEVDVPNRSPQVTVLLDVSVLTAPTRALLLSLNRVSLLFLSKNCAVEKFLMLWQNTYNVVVLYDVA